MRSFRLAAVGLVMSAFVACGDPADDPGALQLSRADQALATVQSTSVTVISPKAILEPSASPSDKDGYPPASSSADPEEGTLGVSLAVASPIQNPRVVVVDDKADAVDDLTLNEAGASAAGVTRNVDGLDGVADGVLAPGTYFLYFNLDKTGYDANLPSSSATASLKGDIERYTVSLQGSNVPATSTTYTVSMQGSASIDQNDLRWLETAPGQILANVGDTFAIRTKYSHQSAGSLYEMILQSYYQGRTIRLEQVNLYYYDTNGAEIASVQAGVPAGWQQRFVNTPYLPQASQPAALSSGDRWVGEFIFRVVGAGGSGFVPYFQTKPSATSNWKIDTGYDGFQVEPPGEINPAILNIHKAFGSPAVVSGSEPPVVGKTTTYDLVLTVSNTGLDDAVNTVVTDVIPAGVTFAGNFTASQGSATWDAAAAKITWNVGTLAADPDGTRGPAQGGSATLHFHVSVTPTQAQVGTRIRLNDGAYTRGNSRLSGGDVFAGPSEHLDTTAVGMPVHALSLQKAVDLSSASPGDTLTYSLTYRNSGNLTETNAVVSDTLPPRTRYVSSTGGTYDAATNTVSFSLGTLAPGDTGTLSVVVTLDAVFPSGTTVIANTGVIRSTDVPPTSSNTVQTTVTAAPSLSLSKTVDHATAAPGDVLTYTLAYANTGNADAAGVVLSDVLPAHTTFLSASHGGAFSAGSVTWQLGTVAAGASGSVSFTVRLDAVFPAGNTTVVNTATVSSPSTSPVTSNPVTTIVNAAPILGLSKSVNRSTAAPGELLTYALAYQNSGNAAATAVVLTDTLPARTTFVSASGGGTYANGVVTWNLGTVAAGASGVVTLVVQLDAVFPDGTTTVANTAVLQSGSTPPASGGTSTVVTAAPVLTLSKAVDLSTASPGQLLTYTLSYQNSGNSDAAQVVVTDAVPARTTFVSASNGGTLANGVVTWSVGTVPAGATGSVTLTVRLDATFPNGLTAVSNSAVVRSATTGPTPSNTVVTTVSAAPSLSLTKSVDSATAVPGQLLTYTLGYANTGNADASGVVLVDPLPARTTFVSASHGGTLDADGTVRWSIGAVPVGTSGAVTLTVRLDAVFPAGQTVVSNTAVLQSQEVNPVPSNDVPTTVTAAPTLGIVKTVIASTRQELSVANVATVSSAQTGPIASAPTQTGDSRLATITYRIDVSNSGNADASSVVVSDPLAANVAFVSANGGSYDAATRTVTWNRPTLAAGETWSVELVISVP